VEKYMEYFTSSVNLMAVLKKLEVLVKHNGMRSDRWFFINNTTRFVYNEEFYKTFEKPADVWKKHWDLVKKLDKEAREQQGIAPSKYL
jgi:hypothetical protein